MNNIRQDDMTSYKTFRDSYKTEEFEKFYKKFESAGVVGIRDLTSDEKSLEDYMKNERSKYVKDFMKKDGEHKAFPPAEPFYSQKKRIKESNLYTKVFAPMPKGGLLHVHSCAGLSLNGLIRLISDWNQRHKSDDNNHIYIISKDEGLPAPYILGMLLYGEQLGELKEFCSSFTEYILTTEGMDKVRELFAFNGEYVEEIPYAWDFFNQIFLRTSGLFCNIEFYKEYHIHFFKECLEDKIPYVEVRSGFETFNKRLVHEMVRHSEFSSERAIYFYEMLSEVNPDAPDDEFLKTMHEAMEAVEGISVKVILNARRDLKPRGEDLLKLSKKVDAAIRLMEKYNSDESSSGYRDFLIGFDFVSEEDRGETTDAYAQEIIYRQVGSGYGEPEGLPRVQKINFFLHDGESDWPENNNMVAAAAICRHRIGHGISLVKNPALLDQIANQKAGLVEPVLEICPISNQILRYHKDIRNHSLLELLKRGILCVIANDDPQLLGNPGLSYDFWEVFVALDLPLAVLKGMILIAYYYRNYDYTVDTKADPGLDRKRTEQEILKAAYEAFKKDWDGYVGDVIQRITPSE